MDRKNVEDYSLVVCFVLLACFGIASGVMIYNIIRMIAPAWTIGTHTFTMHFDNDQFWSQSKPRCSNYEHEGCGEGGIRPPEDMLTQRRTASYAMTLRNEVRESKQTVVQMLIVMGIAAFFFVPHWWIARRAREATTQG